MVLLLAGCGQASITSSAPQTSADSQYGEVVVDFFQNDDQVGKLYVRTQAVIGDFVLFLIEVPIIDDPDYRLDSVEFEFRSEVIQPLIMVEPSGGTLTQGISFTRVDSMVRLSVPDTGRHGDGTVLFKFLAGKEIFDGNKLQLHAELGFGSGDAVADLLIEPPPAQKLGPVAGNELVNASLNVPFELTVGQRATVEPEEPYLSFLPWVEFVSIEEDSRCPLDVVCIHAGRARVNIQVRFDAQDAGIQELTLEVGNVDSNADRVSAASGVYLIEASVLDPYPRTSVQEAPEYILTLNVTKIPN